MTVHHPEYDKGARAPADWDESNPVSSLTLHGRFLAALTGPAEALDVAEDLLRRGLAERGVGAKTAAGYGRARRPDRVYCPYGLTPAAPMPTGTRLGGPRGART
jgi:CRISPR-associated protein Cmr6